MKRVRTAALSPTLRSPFRMQGQLSLLYPVTVSLSPSAPLPGGVAHTFRVCNSQAGQAPLSLDLGRGRKTP